MISENGVINVGGKDMGQITIIKDNEGGKRVQLYTPDGIFLCACPFSGEDDIGFHVGQALYNGYLAGQQNTMVAVAARVNRAIYEKNELAL